jgi:NAD-dependent SIR2 family protein deacetylase
MDSFLSGAPGDLHRQPAANDLARLRRLIEGAKRLVVLTGAGCSTSSGIPEYRDEQRRWKGAQPMLYEEFVADPGARKRYWARSLAGFERIATAQPNAAHFALAELEASGRVELLITQNVDGLHGRAGSKKVLELHGGLQDVVCLSCRGHSRRAALQTQLKVLNPGWTGLTGPLRPDGDAQLSVQTYHEFTVPDCSICGGILKPDVVFFGEAVPKPRAARALNSVREADAVLVVGSSLTVLSGFRLAREAWRLGKPVAAINRGSTRADEFLDPKIDGGCEQTLAALAARLRGAGDVRGTVAR